MPLPSRVHTEEPPYSSSSERPPLLIMGPEFNIDSILALEKRIEEGIGDVIQLKRARNSLLNISTCVPPEILGHIFRWNVIPEGEFGGLGKDSYNFLLVCHHWFQVASRTPALWSFWGVNPKQWSQRYRRSGTAPLDLVLNAYYGMRGTNASHFDGPLRDALRDRAASDSLRSVHLQGLDTALLRSVISLLTPGDGNIRCSGIESLILRSVNLDFSDFLACYHFPKLRNLRLSTCAGISSWDLLKLQSTFLTALSLKFGATSRNLPSSQLHSILASYPNLQYLSLCQAAIPQDAGNGSTTRVALRHLKKLHLEGDCRCVFQLLDRLEYPDTLDHVGLELLESAPEGISKSLAPYLQDRIRRDDRFQARLGIRVSSKPGLILFKIDTLGEFNVPATPQMWNGHPSMSFRALFRETLPRKIEETLYNDLVALTPRERVVGFAGGLSTRTMRDLVAAMPNIEDLSLVDSVVSDVFLQPDPPSRAKLLPSLRRLFLGRFTLQNDHDWSPLINYLTHQTSGGQAISLRLSGDQPPVPPEVARVIEDLVEEFNIGYPGEDGK